MKLFAPLLILFALTLPSCTCFQPAHRNDPGCAVLNQVVDCTEANVEALIPQFKPIVLELIAKATGADGTIDQAALDQSLIALGVKDGGCILADIENDYVNKPTGATALPPRETKMRASYHQTFQDYRAKKWPGIKFKVRKPDGTKVTL